MTTTETPIERYQREEIEKKLRNTALLDARIAAFNARTGPRVGDYLRLPRWHSDQPEFTRFTHDWGDAIQTGGGQFGQFFFTHNGYLSYSGGLDPGVVKDDLIPTTEERLGRVWFFDQEMSGAGRGVDFDVVMRVFKLAKDAKLDGLHELGSPYSLSVLTPSQMRERNVKRFQVEKNHYHHDSFNTESDLSTWLTGNQLKLAKPLDDPRGYQRLEYIPNLCKPKNLSH